MFLLRKEVRVKFLILKQILSELKNPYKFLKQAIPYLLDPNKTKTILNRIINEYELNHNKQHLHSTPYSIHLLCQAQCNIECEFCGFDYRTQADKNQMSFEDFKKIIKNLHPAKINEVIYSGQGEPLLCKDLDKMARYIKSNYNHILNCMNTNGLLLKGDKAKLVSEYFDQIIISLHSMEAETYKQITGVNGCERVIENLRAFRKLNPKMPLVLYFTYSTRNIEEIKKHIDFAEELGNTTFLGTYYKFYSHKAIFSDHKNDDNFQTLDKDLSLYYHQEYSDKIMKEAMKYAEQKCINAIFPALFETPFTKRETCQFPFTSLEVHYDGTIFPCGGADIWMYNEITEGKLNFGNILKNDIKKIWNNKDYKELRQSANGGCSHEDRLNKRCGNCSTMSFYLDSANVEESHFIKRS